LSIADEILGRHYNFLRAHIHNQHILLLYEGLLNIRPKHVWRHSAPAFNTVTTTPMAQDLTKKGSMVLTVRCVDYLLRFIVA
jgi:hypothetical protein